MSSTGSTSNCPAGSIRGGSGANGRTDFESFENFLGDAPVAIEPPLVFEGDGGGAGDTGAGQDSALSVRERQLTSKRNGRAASETASLAARIAKSGIARTRFPQVQQC